jgi:hypothetical protein
MTQKKFAKVVSLIVAWGIFLSLVVLNWNQLSVARSKDLTDAVKLGGVIDLVEWHAGHLLLFSLIIGFVFICFRRNRNERLRGIPSASEDDQECDEFIRAVDRDCDPAYSSLGGNIHHKIAFDKDWEWKNPDP